MGDEHQLHPDGAWLRLSGGSNRLVQPTRVELQVVEHDECVVLPGYGKPEIFNTDQGSQFTSLAFTNRLKQEGIKISMDGKGRWADNVFVKRF